MKPLNELTPKSKIGDILDLYPFVLDFLVDLSPKYKLLKNPIARKTVGAVATLSQVASIGGIDIKELITFIANKINEKTGEKVKCNLSGSELQIQIDAQVRHEILKDIIRDLHAGVDVESVKGRFQEIIKDIDASEISKMEQRLIEEGMPETEVKRLCDVHVQVFKESLESKDVPVVPEGHPVHTFMAENRASENLMNKLESICQSIGENPLAEDFHKYKNNLEKLLLSLLKIDLHYLRKENQLFPVLEKHDFTGPSKVMWALHDDIRAMLKNCKRELENGNPKELVAALREVIGTIRDMIYKEEHILYPVCIDTLSAEEWAFIKSGEAEIGYAWIEPEGEQKESKIQNKPERDDTDAINLETGRMTSEQINLLLKNLPVDISFVNENDEVVYYSATSDRIFPRSPGIIGRKVQNCHPPKSIHIVKQILEEFRTGERDSAEFWIETKGRFIHIRYFAIRDKDKIYKGCMEVSQDVTEIRSLKGEKRLM